MSNELDKIRVEITAEELEEKIRQYYSSQDEAISEIDVKYSEHYVQGQWSEAWQYHQGGYIDIKVDVEIKRKIKALDEERIIKNSITLKKKDIIDILWIILKKDDLEVKNITPDIFREGFISISCTKLVNNKKEEKENFDSKYPFYKKKGYKSRLAKGIRKLFN